MVTCSKCHAYIDSDDDCDCFIGDTDIVACERCRERMEQAGELDSETNTLTDSKETFLQFMRRIESEPREEP
jgi:hypothetical protein